VLPRIRLCVQHERPGLLCCGVDVVAPYVVVYSSDRQVGRLGSGPILRQKANDIHLYLSQRSGLKPDAVTVHENSNERRVMLFIRMHTKKDFAKMQGTTHFGMMFTREGADRPSSSSSYASRVRRGAANRAIADSGAASNRSCLLCDQRGHLAHSCPNADDPGICVLLASSLLPVNGIALLISHSARNASHPAHCNALDISCI
jgi:hypothetical protein